MSQHNTDEDEYIDFRIQRQNDTSSSSDSESSVQDDYQERINLLKKINNDEIDDINSNVSINQNDLDLLNKKLQRQNNTKQNVKDKQKKKTKKSYISPSFLKAVTMTSLLRLYRYERLVQSEEEQAKILSYFEHEELNKLEKASEQGSLQNKMIAILNAFQRKFDLKRSKQLEKRSSYDKQLYPDQYIVGLASLLSAMKIKSRLVLATDMRFTDLEKKFRVKALPKKHKHQQEMNQGNNNTQNYGKQPEIEKKDLKEMFSKTNSLFDQEPESLDQFVFSKEKSKTKNLEQKDSNTNPVKQTFEQFQIIEQIKSKGKKQEKINHDLFELNNNMWIEIFNLETNKWVPFDPISDQLCEFDQKIIQRKLDKTASFFIFSTQQIVFKDQFIKELILAQREFREIYFIDLSWKYLIQYHFHRIQLQLEKWYNTFAREQKLIYNGLTSLLETEVYVKPDREAFRQYQLKLIPHNEKDFKYHPFFALESQLNQYQMVKPGSQPMPFKIKDEPVYLKEDVIILHSKDRWRNLLLEVRDDVQPMKEVSGRFDKTKITPLYAEWQCKDLKISVADNDGKLPANPYGNFEIFIHPPPEGTIIFEKLGIKRQLQKASIPFIEAVQGFDMKSGKMFAQKIGYLIFKKDYDKVQELYENNLEEMKEKNKKNRLKQLQKQWSDLFKAILVKKQLQESYE